MIRFTLVLLTLLPSVALAAADPDPTEQAAIDAVAKLGGKAAVNAQLDAVARVEVRLKTATDATLVKLGKLPSVGAITIDDATKCTEKGFAALKELPDLQELVLSKSAVGDRAAAAIAGVRPLQVLYLGESKVTDAGLAGFKTLKNLRVLDLYKTGVTDKGLAHLSTLAKLEDLNLSGTKVTDKGVPALKGLTALKLVRLNGTNVTREGVSVLEAALPKATVRW